ncbi:MAG: hypothetical protein ACYC5K_02485 [Saccharofermentanales bacterium]
MKEKYKYVLLFFVLGVILFGLAWWIKLTVGTEWLRSLLTGILMPLSFYSFYFSLRHALYGGNYDD